MKKGKFVDTNPYTYATLCDAYKTFSMPHNQRPYAWKNSHVLDLWNAIIENSPGYFIGNLVCLEPSDDSNNSLVIIDGQQRLTTISLFLIAFKYIFSEYESKKITNIIQEQINLIDDYLFWRNPRTQKNIPRLKPGKEGLMSTYNILLSENNKTHDSSFYKALNDNQVKYFTNLKFIEGTIKKEIKNRRDEEIEEIVNKILNVQFIAIVVESENDIYDLFEGLNSTGLGLSIADLIKNAVLKAVPIKTLQNNIESNWMQIETLFEDTKTSLFPRFLRHYWISRNGYINASRLFKVIKKEKIERRDANGVASFTKELLDDAQIYVGLRFEDHESSLLLVKKNEKLKRLFNVFRYLGGLDQIYEVLLALYNKKQADSEYKPSNFKEDIQRLLNFAILAKFVSINPSDYETLFASLCECSVKYSGIKYEKEAGHILKKLFKLVDKDKEFADNFSEDLEYGSNSKLIEYLIAELIRNYSEEDRGITTLDPNIEHILPQTPKKWGYSKEQVSNYVNKIGNLTILNESDNNDAGNETMGKKIEEVYLRSKFKFNRDLKKYKKEFMENPEMAIKNRGIELGFQAFNILKIL